MHKRPLTLGTFADVTLAAAVASLGDSVLPAPRRRQPRVDLDDVGNMDAPRPTPPDNEHARRAQAKRDRKNAKRVSTGV